MAQRDYILRLIEQAGLVLARLLRALRGGEVDPAAAEADLGGVADRAGLDLDVLRAVDLDTLVRLVSPGGEPEMGRAWLAAELFAVEGERLALLDRPAAAADAWHRSLRLYSLVDPHLALRGLPEVPERVAWVRERLDTLPDPSEVAPGAAPEGRP